MNSERRISEAAIFSLVCSLFLLLPVISALAGIILGVVALYHIGNDKNNLRGRGLAIAGIAFGLAQFLIILIFLFKLVSPQYDFSMARLCENFKLKKKAIQYYEKAGLNYARLRQFDVGINEFPTYNNLALLYFSTGNFDKAMDAYRRALKVAQNSLAQAHYGIGSVYRDRQDYAPALNEFDQAIENNPDFVLAYQNRASTLRYLGRFEESVRACQKTISLFPRFAQAYSTMGLAYEKLGRYEDALRAHLQAIELNPLRSFPRERLFYCFYRIRENKSVVDELLKRLNELDPDLSGEIQEKLEKGEVAPENSFDNLNQWPAQPYRSFRLYGGKHYKSQ